jgi:hypothetical protein
MGCVLIGSVDVGRVLGILDNSFRPSSLPFVNKNFFATRIAANPQRARLVLMAVAFTAELASLEGWRQRYAREIVQARRRP